jgi:5-methylcytosine-specific restriction endonuclease McrA
MIPVRIVDVAEFERDVPGFADMPLAEFEARLAERRQRVCGTRVLPVASPAPPPVLRSVVQRAAKWIKSLPRGRARYQAYINSAAWHTKRRELIKTLGGHCEHCNATEEIQVHHKHYRTLGAEQPEDVTLLCRLCHARIHQDTPFGWQSPRRNVPVDELSV